MPTYPYNGGQSPLEDYAINGNPLYPGSGRLALINQTAIGTGKYTFQGPYKNPQILTQTPYQTTLALIMVEELVMVYHKVFLVRLITTLVVILKIDLVFLAYQVLVVTHKLH
jgi:hypothetical protein